MSIRDVAIIPHVRKALRKVFDEWMKETNPSMVGLPVEERYWQAFYGGAVVFGEFLGLMAQELKKRLDSDDLVH